MAKDYPRSYRVADQIQRELAVIIRDQLKDPGVSSLLTISEVEVSKDLSIATVFFTVLDDDKVESSQQGLTRAAGFLRSSLGKKLSLRIIPELRFRYDHSVTEGPRMDAIINAAVQADLANKKED